jgi:hypothetical protein
VFRWFDPNATDTLASGTRDWLEFAPIRSSVFDMTPSRLMWIKASQSKALDLGAGITMSLRDTFEMVIAPNDWTDFALPYTYSMNIGDIVAATGPMADTLEFYSWARSGRLHTTQPLYIRSLPDSTLRNRLNQLHALPTSGYSVHNPTDSAITLRVPPICAAMSTATSGLPKVKDGNAGTSWALKVVPWAAGDLPLTTVVCGFVRGRSRPSYYAAAPTFATAGVRVADTDGSKQYGHMVHHATDGFGGFSYRLMFYNESDKPTSISYSVLTVGDLPDSLHVSLVDEANGTVVRSQETLSIRVPAKSRVYRTLAVGDKYYASRFMKNVAPFTRFALYPNPFRGALTMSFMMPESVKHVECRLFDPRGRVVWQHNLRKVRSGRLNTVVWDGLTPQRRPVAAGTYVLRLSALDTDGARVATLKRQVTHLR